MFYGVFIMTKLLFLLILLLQTQWTIETGCLPEAITPPDGLTFDGVILTYQPDEGIRALRSDVPTTYYIAFEGSNFTAAGSMSPDGKWVAFPYGYIQTAATSDVRYIVNELRVHSTERVPRIAARMGWTVSYQIEDGIPPIRWLDNETLLFETGADHDLVQVNPFTTEITESELDAYTSLSPHLTRGIAPYFERNGLFDIESGDLLTELPNGSMEVFEWSNDSLMTVDFPQLTLRDHDGAMLETLMTFSEDQRVWNFHWSGDRFTFSLYDPYKNENFLYVGDVNSRTLTETCFRLRNEPSSVEWSPDGTMLALLGYESGLYIYDLNENVIYQVAEYTGGLIGWGEF
jgi:hypothetical protein